MKLEEPYNSALEFRAAGAIAEPQKITTHTPAEPHRLAYVESQRLTHVFTREYDLAGTLLPNGGVQVTLITRNQGWRVEK